jgi:hypothetical protein
VAVSAVLAFDLIVNQGSDYRKAFPVLGLEEGATLTGWSAAGQIRETKYEGSALLHTLAVSLIGTDLVVTIPAATSAAWTWGFAWYDVELTAPDDTEGRFLEGLVEVRNQSTR